MVYGVLHSSEYNQWIGMEINFLDKKITVLDCSTDKSKDMITSHVTPFLGTIPFNSIIFSIRLKSMILPESFVCFAELFPAILNSCTSYHLVNMKKNILHTKVNENCTLFVVKMIQCYSMRIENFSKLRDQDSEDIRNKLAIDIFKELC